jgi:hypothetical protein
MSLIFAESGDQYQTPNPPFNLLSSADTKGKWSSGHLQTTVGRRGTRGFATNISLAASTGLPTKNLGPQTGLVVGLAVFLNSAGGTHVGFSDIFGVPEGGFGITLGTDGLKYLKLSVANDGSLQVSRSRYPESSGLDGPTNYFGSGGCVRLWLSDPGVFQFGTWNYLEFKAIASYDDGVGRIVVRLNGEELVDQLGRTVPWNRGDSDGTAGVNPSYFSQFSFNELSGSLDDLYILNLEGSRNNDFLGDLQVDLILPDGAGLRSDSTIIGTTPLATRWQSERTADGAVSAVQFDATDDSDSYTFEDLPYSTATIYGVQLSALARKADSGSARMALTNDLNALAVDASPVLLTPSAGDIYAYREAHLDESADGPWTLEKVQDSEFGVRREELP